MNNRGLTLVEILVTIVILSVALLSIAQVLNKTVRDYSASCDKLTAYYLADDVFQEIKSFVRKSDTIEYAGTRMNNKNISNFAGIKNPPENILNLPMKEYSAWTRQITVNKISTIDNRGINTDNLYEISVKIMKNKKQLVDLEWIEYFNN